MSVIDLPAAIQKLNAIIEAAVAKYVQKHRVSATAKEHPPVTRIDLAFSLGDGDSAPWIHLHLDTKPGSEPDGSPTHPDYATASFEEWLPAVQAAFEGETATVVMPGGNQKQCHAEDLAETIGQVLVQTLLDAREGGVFQALPTDNRCELGVEDPTTGAFGWPNYDDRGKGNLVK
jgi:hypothetical protein